MILKCVCHSVIVLSLAEMLTPAWLALLTDPRLHSSLCGLISRTAFLLQLLETSEDARHLCNPFSLQTSLQEVFIPLSQNGVHFPSALTAAIVGEQLL